MAVLDRAGREADAAGYVGNFPMPAFLGGWVLLAIIAASMSTGDGAILAMSTTFAHNLLRKALPLDDKKLLLAARLATILWAPLAAAIASGVPGETSSMWPTWTRRSILTTSRRLLPRPPAAPVGGRRGRITLGARERRGAETADEV